MDKKTITQIATAALITTAGISVTNNLKPLNITGSGNEVKAATTQSAQQFIDKAAPAAVNASSKYGTYTSVMMAQAAVESGWGNSTLSQEPNNNLFGIKGSYNGQSVAMKTGEYGSNGYYTTTANFRKYPSYEESFNDNGALLRSQMGNYYSGTWVENADSAEDATQNGLQGKYATAPNYASTLNNVIDTYDLKQYDPVTTEVNETKTVTNTTPITDAPVDSDVANQVGTAREGQQLNVTKYITYQNGVKHAYVGSGWVNNSAFATQTATSQASTAAATQQSASAVTSQASSAASVASSAATVSKKVATKPVTQTTTVKQSAASSKAPASASVKQVVKKATPVTSVAKTAQRTVTTKKASATVKKNAVKTSAPVATTKAPVTPKSVASTATSVAVKSTVKATSSSAPKVKVSQKSTASSAASVAKTAPVVTKVVAVEQASTSTSSSAPKAEIKTANVKSDSKSAFEKKTTVAKVESNKEKQAVSEIATNPVLTSTKKATPTKSAKKTIKDVEVDATKLAIAPKAEKSASKVETKSTSSASTATPSRKVVVKKTVTKKAEPAKLASNTITVATSVKTPKAVPSSKASSNVEKLTTKPIVETATTKAVSAQASQIGNDYVIKAKGVLTINARPNYGVAIWTIPGKKRTARYLQNGTSWKFFKIAMVNGEKWYNLGGNQWVPAKAVMVR